jgi:hypothetical protein
LHEANLTITALHPTAEITLFVSNTPNQIRIDAITRRFARDRSIVAMNPILIEKVKSGGNQEQGDEDDGQLLHRVNRVTRLIQGREVNGWRFQFARENRDQKLAVVLRSMPS